MQPNPDVAGLEQISYYSLFLAKTASQAGRLSSDLCPAKQRPRRKKGGFDRKPASRKIRRTQEADSNTSKGGKTDQQPELPHPVRRTERAEAWWVGVNIRVQGADQFIYIVCILTRHAPIATQDANGSRRRFQGRGGLGGGSEWVSGGLCRSASHCSSENQWRCLYRFDAALEEVWLGCDERMR